MRRAAIMPFTGDPFLLTVWLDLYSRIWKSEVDHVVILFNTDNTPSHVREYCERLMEFHGVQYISSPTRLNHGPAIDVLLSSLRDHNPANVVLLEEDAFVFKAGHIDSAFNMLETNQYDVVAGRRGCCSNWILELGKQLWGTEDHGPNFWPNFFFCSYDRLTHTDRIFGARTWQPGEEVFRLSDDDIPAGLNPYTLGFETEISIDSPDENVVAFTTKNQASGDTFVNTTLQLRKQGLKPDRILWLPQYHASPNDLYDSTGHKEYQHVFDGECYWIHVGSLSSWRSFIFPTNDELPGKVAADDEYGRRLVWWQLFATTAKRLAETNDRLPPHAFVENLRQYFYDYCDGIARVMTEYNLSQDDFVTRLYLYKNLLNI